MVPTLAHAVFNPMRELWQGDVESIASKSPKELLKHFELFCGSWDLKYVACRRLEYFAVAPWVPVVTAQLPLRCFQLRLPLGGSARTSATISFTFASCREEYDSRWAEAKAAESEMVHKGQKKRALALERKALAEQKREADRYAATRAKLEHAQTQYTLWKLFHVERSITEASQGLDVSMVLS